MKMRLAAACAALLALAADGGEPEPFHATFSIVCRDPSNGDFAVGVTTMPRAVRRHCPFARAGVGAVSTQALTNSTYGPRGLDLMASGKTPEQAVKELTEADRGRDQRQVGMIDARGAPFSHTGSRCIAYAGHIVGRDYAIQGNLLVGKETLEAVEKAFVETPGSLAGRVIAALVAGKAAGGDKRGHSSCAVIVASKRAEEGKLLIDLFEDNNPEPVDVVRRRFQAECARWFEPGDRVLERGAEGPDVRRLTAELKALRLLAAEADAYGEAVEAAVRRLQREAGLEETGRADAAAVRALARLVRDREY
jgi:uncharacterized Ntn-hydrolase superfamily protein